MNSEPSFINLATIKVGGSALRDEMEMLHEIVVENSMYVPDMAEITFYDHDYTLVDGTTFSAGAEIEILLGDANDSQLPSVFKGEIVGMEPIFDVPGSRIRYVVRAYDKSHRLHRGNKTLVHLEKKDSDLATAIANEAGLTPEVETTQEVFKHIYQNALSDMEFLRRRAERIGFEVFVSEGKLYFRKPDPTGTAIDLDWGETLAAFRPRVSLANQVEEVTVRGWDAKAKKAIEGKASNSKTAPQVGFGGWGGAKAKTAFASAKSIVVSHPVQSQADAKSVAKGILDDINSGFIEAEGEALGSGQIVVGGLVNIKGVGTTFSGKYKVTSVQHVYAAGDYRTYFTVSGPRPNIVTHQLERMDSPPRHWPGVVPAIVTKTETDTGDDWATVAVKYPWMDDKLDSYWARLVIPGGGKERGMYFMPEVNDEVLVAFANGDFNQPYVLGGLFNGKDKAILPLATAVEGGKTVERIIKSRTGHTIRMRESDSDELIEIVTNDTNIQILMDAKNKVLDIINKQGDINITAKQGTINIVAKEIVTKSTQDTKMTATGNFKISATQNADFKATGKVAIVGTAGLDAKSSAMANFEGTGPTTLKSSAILTVQGSLVKIN